MGIQSRSNEPVINGSEGNAPETISNVVQISADNRTIANSEEKEKVNDNVVSINKRAPKMKRKCNFWGKTKGKKTCIQYKDIYWKLGRASSIDLSIWRSHLTWFSRINRGSQCLDDTYKDFVELVRVESVVGVLFNKQASSAEDGLTTQAIQENWLTDATSINDSYLSYLLSKSPLYKYHIEGMVWRKWYLSNNDPSEDIHWQGILYLRKIWANLLEVKDYYFLLLFLDVMHPKCGQAIVEDISKALKIPICPRIHEIAVRMLCVLFAEGEVVKEKLPQLPSVSCRNPLNKLEGSHQESDLSPDSSKKTSKVENSKCHEASISQKEHTVGAIKSFQNASVCPSEAALPSGSSITTPVQPVVEASEAAGAKNSALVKSSMSSISPVNVEKITACVNAITTVVSESEKCSIVKKSDESAVMASPKLEIKQWQSPSNGGKIQRRRTLSSPLTDPRYLVPLKMGWVREGVHRKVTDSSRVDVYYHPPTGKKLRSNVEIQKYLKEANVLNLTIDNFSFHQSFIGCGPPYELQRGANEGTFFMKKKEKKEIVIKSDGPFGKRLKTEKKKDAAPRKQDGGFNSEQGGDAFIDEATITNEMGETTGYEEFLNIKNVVPKPVTKESEVASSASSPMEVEVINVVKNVNKSVGARESNLKESSRKELLAQSNAKQSLDFYKSSSSNNSAVLVGTQTGKTAVPARKICVPNILRTNTRVKGREPVGMSNKSLANTIPSFPFQLNTKMNPKKGACGRNFLHSVYGEETTDVSFALTKETNNPNKSKGNSNKTSVKDDSETVLDNKWHSIIEKYKERIGGKRSVNRFLRPISVPVIEYEVKDDSASAVPVAQNESKIDKLPLRIWHEAVGNSKPSTSGLNNSNVARIKVRPLSELSANVDTPVQTSKPNTECTRVVWTYCPD